MNLIISAAGKSSRFPKMKPKWMLVHPMGDLMILEAIKGLNLKEIDHIYIVTLREYVEKYSFIKGLENQFKSINQFEKFKLIILDEPTQNQAETVAQAIKIENINGPIYIKDTDNRFTSKVMPMNAVATFCLDKMKSVNAQNKSYVTLNDKGIITNIAEKQLISNRFCVGGYSFADSGNFLKHYWELRKNSDLYISHIIYRMILHGEFFENSEVSEYDDWGTLTDWNNYKTFYSTLFIDLDGTLIENSGQHFEPLWGQTKAINENVQTINKLFDSGKVKIIITTSRKESFRNITLEQLDREGIKYHDIIFELAHAKRIIINDYARSNPYKSCDAINVKRDSTDLKEILEEALGFGIEE